MATVRNTSIKIIAFLFCVFIVFVAWLYFSLPDKTTILKYRPESTVDHFQGFAWDKEILTPVRKYIPLRFISPELKTAVIVSEDDTFYEHSGINISELKIALQENISKKRYVRGASTISMQLTRNAFLNKQKTLIRKIKEIILTKRIEATWTKEKIFEYYLNIVEWGRNIYGAEAASYYYFNKPASELNLAEATLMAGILPNPIRFNPFTNWSQAKKKQLRILKLMHNSGLLSNEEFKKLITQKIYLRGTKPATAFLQQVPDISIFKSALKNPRIPESYKRQADSTGILFLPEEQ